jgi:hypothetical protein
MAIMTAGPGAHVRLPVTTAPASTRQIRVILQPLAGGVLTMQIAQPETAMRQITDKYRRAIGLPAYRKYITALVEELLEF